MNNSATIGMKSWTQPAHAALAVLGIAIFAGTIAGSFVYLAGGIVLAILVAVAFFFPETMLFLFVTAAILVPEDLAFKVGELPRLGPVRFLLAVLFTGGSLRGIFSGPSPGREGRPLIWPITFFMVCAAFSAALSIVPLMSWFQFFSYLLEQALMFYVLLAYLKRPGFWPRMKKFLFAVTAIVCIAALFEEITHYNPVFLIYPDERMEIRGGILRVRSCFFHPIALGCYINLIFPFVMVDIIKKRNWSERVPLLTLLAAMLLTLFFTGSRGPWISFALEAFVFFMWFGWRKRVRWLIAVAGAGIAAAGLMFIVSIGSIPGGPIERLVNPNGVRMGSMDEGSSEYYRILLARAVMESMQGKRLIYGYGPDSFFMAGIQSKWAGDDHVMTSADGFFFMLLFEYGIVGFIAFIAMLFGAVRVCIKAAKNAGYPGSLLALGCGAGVAGLILENATVNMFFNLPIAILFWMSIAVAYYSGDLSKEGIGWR